MWLCVFVMAALSREYLPPYFLKETCQIKKNKPLLRHAFPATFCRWMTLEHQRKFFRRCQSSFCLCWSIHSRVQPQVSLPIQMVSLYPGVDSLPYAALWINHEICRLWMALIFMKQSLCGQSQRAPHSRDSSCIVQRWRGWRGHVEATHKTEQVLKFLLRQQEIDG